MHARLDHLLSRRDGEPLDAEISAHIEQCPSCSARLQDLVRCRAQLRSLPQKDAPESSWERIQARLTAPEERRSRGGLVAGLALVVLATVLVVAVRDDRDRVADTESTRSVSPAVATPQTPDPETEPVMELVAQSQELEHLLQALPERPHIERVSTAATIDAIEQRIQWLDWQLSYAPDAGLSEEQARQLWRERVELMDSLVKVRYAQAHRTWF
jgi:anti-sigma factor RsiW